LNRSVAVPKINFWFLVGVAVVATLITWFLTNDFSNNQPTVIYFILDLTYKAWQYLYNKASGAIKDRNYGWILVFGIGFVCVVVLLVLGVMGRLR